MGAIDAACFAIWTRCSPSESFRYMCSLEFPVKRIMIKLFHTYDNSIIDSCMTSFGLLFVSELVAQRKNKFLLKFNSQDNLLCAVCQ